MTSSRGQAEAEAQMTSSSGQDVLDSPAGSSRDITKSLEVAEVASAACVKVSKTGEAPVASPRVKKRARKEQLLQQHKLFGKTVLDRISKACAWKENKLDPELILWTA